MTQVSKTKKATMSGERQERLKVAVQVSYRSLQPYRKRVVEMVEEYAGPMYTINRAAKRREKHVNLLKQAVSAYMTLLSSNRPRVLVSTHKLEDRAFANLFQTGINRLLEEIKLEKTVNQWVRDAFFWLGIVKVHMADSGEQVAEGDLLMDPGMPFASNVALDDFFYDTNANKWSECQFIGDVYRLPKEHVENSGMYSGDALEDLQASERIADSERLDELSTASVEPGTDLEPMVDVCDIYIPRDGKVYTYIVSHRGENLTLKGDPIAEMQWKGGELGPYKLLHFDEVSENVLPCSTAADLYPLDLLVNNLFRKNAQKATRAKENPTYTPTGVDSAAKIKNAGDGEWVAVTEPREVNVIKSGGVDSSLHGFMLNSMELFDRMAGNLQNMLGLGASTDTVGQEKIVQGANSRREGQLQTAVLAATTDLVTELAFLLWSDKFTTLPSRTEIQGLPGISYDSTWKPDFRMGEFKDYGFEIDVYSMQYQGPGARIQAINQLLQTVYIPLMPMIQQQGGSIDIAKLSDLHAEMLNLPRLKDVVLFNAPPMPPQPQPDGPRKPPTSNRNYTRTNVSAGDNSGVPDASTWQEGDK
jgi:hypothetical protein